MSYEVLENGCVMEVENVKTETQTAVVKRFYGMQYKTRLRYEGERVICEVWTYLNEHAVSFNDLITFDYGGERIYIQAVNGIAILEFVGVSGDEYTVCTANDKFRNGEVTFIA